jgi:L-histidine Nalpha-methyltransferase
VRMDLISRRDQDVHVGALDFHFARDEALHIENSHKYAPEDFAEIACLGGWSVAQVFTDPRKLFSIQILHAGC